MLAVLSAIASLAIAVVLIFVTVLLIAVLFLVGLAVMAGTPRRLSAVRLPRLLTAPRTYARDQLGLRPKPEEPASRGTVEIPLAPSPQPTPAEEPEPVPEPVKAEQPEPVEAEWPEPVEKVQPVEKAEPAESPERAEVLPVPAEAAATGEDDGRRDDEETLPGGTVPFPRAHQDDAASPSRGGAGVRSS